MPKKKSSSKKAARRKSVDVPARHRRIRIALACIAILGVSAATLFAGARTGWFSRSVAPLAPQSGFSLSKEYIYVGGRLLATEEPASVGAPLINSPLDPPEGTQGSNVQLTINGSNLLGASSVNVVPSTGIGVSNLNSTSNQVTAILNIASNAGTGARNISVTVGSQTSNPLPFTVTPQAGNPVPAISSINPPSVQEDGPGFTLDIFGTGFIASSAVKLDGSDRATTFLNTSQLQAQVLSSDITTPGNRNITVSNPGPGGGTSDPWTLTITPIGTNPVPFITSISPSTVIAGGPQFTLTVSSSNASFRSGAVVKLEATPLSTTFVSTSTLTASVIASQITTPGGRNVTVVNPAPGGGPSNTKVLTVTSGGGGGGGTGLQGDYFNNMTLSGTPALTRTDPTVNFSWNGAPGPGINPDQFSIRWTGQVQAVFSETYTFRVETNDGVRLWVNNQLLVDKWFDQSAKVWSGSIALIGGQKYDIRMEHYDNTGPAYARLYWRGPSTSTQIIPQSQLFPPVPPVPPLYEGRFESADCSALVGWAADRNHLNTVINVEIREGSTLLATVPANLLRTDIGAVLGDNGLHGFSWTVPQSLKNGQPHTISVKFAGTSASLTDSPRTITCSAPGAPPTAPSNLSASVVSPSQINLLWTDTSNNENGFAIERKIGSLGVYGQISTVNANVTTYSDLGRSPGITYYYRVKAFNGDGPSAFSNEASATTPGGSSVPAPPSGLGATMVSSSRVDLSWTDNSDNEFAFEIQRRIVNASGLPVVGFKAIRTLLANTTAYSDISPHIQNYTYVYRVAARNGDGYSDFSNEASVLITSAPQCALVNALSGTSGGSGYGYMEGPSVSALWRSPMAAISGIDPVSGLNALFVADTENHSIRMIYLDGPVAGSSILLAGSGIAGQGDGGGDPFNARYNYPRGITAIRNQSGVVEMLLIADTDNHMIRSLLPPLGGSRWRPAPFSGAGTSDVGGYSDGPASSALFNAPYGLVFAADGLLYVADRGNKAIRRLNLTGYASTLYKAPGLGLFQPVGIVVSETSGRIYVSDQANHRISDVSTGTPTVIAGSGSPGYTDGTGTFAVFNTPYHLAWINTGGSGSIYIVDYNNHRIRLLNLTSNAVSTWAGNGSANYVNGTCPNSSFNLPAGVTLGPVDELYVIEKANNTVRQVQ